jgi:FixJ family two-component response regulator
VVRLPDTVIVIDDDAEVRNALARLVRSIGLQVRLYDSSAEFLEAARPDGPTCVVLDIRLPGKSGLDLQRELAKDDVQLPIVFITGYGDIAMSVQAMKGGAIEFLTKPFREQDLLDALLSGIERDRAQRDRDKAIARIRARFNSLTAREREVMAQVVTGRRNKQIATALGISEHTVKLHRGMVLRKMEALSLAELVVMAEGLNASPGMPSRKKVP